MTFKEYAAPFLKLDTYFTSPVSVATILFLLAAFHVPIIFLLVYVAFVYIYDTDTTNSDELVVTASFDYKKKDESIGTVDLKLPVATEPLKKEHAYELLFRDRDSRIIKAFSPQEAIENAKLTDAEKADFVGVEQL